MKEEEYNPKLADKGWDAMRRLLDREMPVGRRRGFAWWSWAILLLLLTGGGLIWKQGRRIPAAPFRTAPEQVSPTPPTAGQPIAASAAPASPGISLSSQYKSENPQVANTAAGNDRAPGAGVRSVTGRQQNPKSESIAKMPGMFKNQAPSGAGFVLGNTNQRTKTTPAASPDAAGTGASDHADMPEAGPVAMQANLSVPPATNSETTPTPETAARTTQTAFLTRPEIENLKTAALQHNLTNCTQMPVIEPFKQKHDRFAFGPSAGIGTEHFRAINAFSTGLTLDWQPFRRWGLRSGVQYGHQNIAPANRPVISVDAYQYAATTMDTRFYLGNNAQTADPLSGVGAQAYYAGKSIIVPISVLHRVDVPLLLYGELYQKIRLYAGVSFSRLIGVGSYDQVLSYDNRVLQVRNQSAVNRLIKTKSSRNTVFYQFGIGRRFGKHWDATVLYEGRFTGANTVSVRQESSLSNGNIIPGKNANNFDSTAENLSATKSFENSPLRLLNLKIAYLF